MHLCMLLWRKYMHTRAQWTGDMSVCLYLCVVSRINIHIHIRIHIHMCLYVHATRAGIFVWCVRVRVCLYVYTTRAGTAKLLVYAALTTNV